VDTIQTAVKIERKDRGHRNLKKTFINVGLVSLKKKRGEARCRIGDGTFPSVKVELVTSGKGGADDWGMKKKRGRVA